MKLIRSVLLLAFSLYLVSCGTQQRIPNYLQNVKDTSVRPDLVVPELRIQKNDILSIQVFSASTVQQVDAPFNLPTTGTTAGAVGFLVDAKGNIQYPRLGVFHVEGLTKDELSAEVKKRLTEPVKYLEDPVVIIRFLNLRITVIGEVNSQGTINIPGEKITILEAVSLAGGITDFGLKNSVKVMREIDGRRQLGVVDLSSDSLFSSAYYNLKQNDVIIVDPTVRKVKQVEQNMVIQRVTFGLSLVTAVALLYNIFN